MTARSYLYLPGNSADRLAARAGERGADAIVFDLEDSVPHSAKESARGLVRAAVDQYQGTFTAYVRVNSDSLTDDINAVAAPGIAGIMVPKATVDLMMWAGELLSAAEDRLGLPRGHFEIIALIESAVGVLTAPQIASCDRVTRLGLGEADLIGELGMRPGPDRAELTQVRTQIVLASAAAGLSGPIGPVETRLRDDVGLAESTRALLALGFRARSAIHPGQLATINEVFTPTPDEVEQARNTIATLGDKGVAVDARGHMLDAAVVRSAYEILSRAGH